MVTMAMGEYDEVDDMLEAVESAGQPRRWWWLSFCGDEGFRGVAIVQGRGIIGAIRQARRLGINPGGVFMLDRTAGCEYDGLGCIEGGWVWVCP